MDINDFIDAIRYNRSLYIDLIRNDGSMARNGGNHETV